MAIRTTYRTQNLAGNWTLGFFDEKQYNPKTVSEYNNGSFTEISAKLPGNADLSLSEHGILPKDIFFGDNILKVRDYETYQWWYSREFDTPEWSEKSRTDLVLDSVDTYARIFINGFFAGECQNAFIKHIFPIKPFLKKDGTKNTIHIQIRPTMLAMIEKNPEEENCSFRRWARKPPHMFGWDIAPRAVSAGIYRGIYLKEKRETELTEVFLETSSLDADYSSAKMRLTASFCTQGKASDFSIKVRGKCNDSSFEKEFAVTHRNDTYFFDVEKPLLWWPRGYGDPNLYATIVELVKDGEVVSRQTFELGIRTTVLDRTDLDTIENPGRFQLYINHVPVFMRGTNWLPADPFHSRDEERIPKMLDVINEMNCNILRVWGGGVYESQTFYSLCDRYGIMVWQDFCMACCGYPQNDRFLSMIREEAISVVKDLRQHTSLVLWCGDNEVDSVTISLCITKIRIQNPNDNKISRQVLPDVLSLYDPTTPFLPSSPCYDEESAMMAMNDTNGDYNIASLCVPECHHYTFGQYYKKYLPNSNELMIHRFIISSELGYAGMLNLSSIKKIISKENLTVPDFNHSEWRNHCTYLMDKNVLEAQKDMFSAQIAALFGKIPENLEDYVLASQISQAEGIKFMVENFRLRKGKTSGVIWWNLIDAWPQISFGAVDYYMTKKLAFYYLQRTHGEVSVMISEPENNLLQIIAVNDTLKEMQGAYTVIDADTNECVASGTFFIDANGRTVCGGFEVPSERNRLYLVEWECGDLKGCNHYLYGKPTIDFENYKTNWLPKIASLGGEFTFIE